MASLGLQHVMVHHSEQIVVLDEILFLLIITMVLSDVQIINWEGHQVFNLFKVSVLVRKSLQVDYQDVGNL